MLKSNPWLTMVMITIAIVSFINQTSAEENATNNPVNMNHLPGLTVNEQGQLLKNGKPYRAIGINYFDAFYRTLLKQNDTSYEAGFKTLAKHNIPFIRFMANGFWPVDCKLYFEDKEAYFSKFDEFVKCAEQHNIGLVPSLFWHRACVPDLMGEPMDQLGNPDSKTLDHIRQYTREVVTRYLDSPAIWMWEFGNEYNLPADLPNADKFRPAISAKKNTASERSKRDDITHEMLAVVFKEFKVTVRKYDKHRPISTGCGAPRHYAWHNWKNKSWDPDTRQQFYEMLIKENPPEYDVISVHLYPKKDKLYFADGLVGMPELINVITGMSLRNKQPLFIGEFGASAKLDPAIQRKIFIEFLTAIEKSRVPLAAAWVFDLSFQEGQWNITTENDRAYMLKLTGEANMRISENP